jgi:hypothetical protein
MTLILQDLPYYDTISYADVNRQLVQIVPHQIVVWVSLSLRSTPALSGSPLRFPAILDTGNSYGFALAERHLEQWAGLTRQMLEELGTVLINRARVPRQSAAVWLHPNKKGERDTFRRAPPFRLDLRDGIAVYPAGSDFQAPRLPLLGLRAIDENKLRCEINGERLRVNLRSPPKPKQRAAPNPAVSA